MTEDASSTSTWSRRGLLLLGTATTVGALSAADPAGIAAAASLSGALPTGANSSARAQLDPEDLDLVDQISVVATPDRFPGLDPTGNSDSADALQQAIVDTPDGGTLLIPPGSYRINSSITNSGKSMSIRGYGATLIKGAAGARVLQMNGTYESPINVSSISSAVITGASGTQTGVQLTLSSSPGWSQGDIVKIVADNIIPGGRPGSGGNESRIGQYMTVASVSGATVLVYGALREVYNANVRVARLLDTRVHVAGLTMTTLASGVSGNWSGEMCSFSSLMMPTVKDVTVLASVGPALVFRGCFGYSVDDVSVNYAKDDPPNSIFGYGILDNSSAYGRVSNYVARKVRHAYTDDTSRVAVGSSVSGYGGTYGTRISNSVCTGSTESAWDTHACSEGVVFNNCHAVDSLRGFNFRGRKHSVIDSSAVGCDYGARFASEGTGVDTSWGHLIDGLRIERSPLGALLIEPYLGGGSAIERRASVVRRLWITESVSPQFKIINAAVQVDDLRIDVPATAPNDTAIMRFANAEVTGKDWHINFKGNTAGTGMQVISARTAGTFRLNGMRVEWNSGTASRLDTIIASDRQVATEIENVILQARIANPSTDLKFGSTMSWRSGADHSGYIERLNAAVSTDSGPGAISRSADRTVFVKCLTYVNRVFAPLLAGALLGQQLIISNSEESGGPVQVGHGSTYRTYMKSGTTVTLEPGENLILLWSGTVWLQV